MSARAQTERQAIQAQGARRLLTRALPDRVRWQQQVLSDWLEREDVTGRPVQAVCPVFCFDDLDVSFGLGQLLAARGLSVRPVFVLPTAPAARVFVARARAAGLHQRIDCIARADLAARQADDFGGEGADRALTVCVVPPLALLTGRNGAMLRTGEGVGWEAATQSLLDLCREDSAHATAHEVRIGQHLDAFRVEMGPLMDPPEPVRAMRVLGLRPQGGGRLTLLALSDLRTDPCELTLRCGSRVFYRRRTGTDPVDASSVRVEPPLEAVRESPLPVELRLHASGVVRAAHLSLHVPPARIEPWMVTCYLNRGGAGNPMIRAFAQGIGCALRYAEDETGPRPGVPLVWGVLRGSDRVVARARQAGQYFFYVDHAYFGRGHGNFYRVTRNAYEAGPVRHCPPDRLAVHGIAPKPWNRGGDSILVCPPTEYFMAAHDCTDWLETTLAALRTHTDRPIVIRRKPQPSETVEPLIEALAKAHAVVTHSSNVAVEAVIAGTPVFVSPASAAAPMGQTDLRRIETPVFPDRAPWLAHLAYSQFSMEEIASGLAWRMLLENEERDFV